MSASAPVTDLLIKSGADAKNWRKPDSGDTLLFWDDRPEKAELLINAGVDINARNREGVTALMSWVTAKNLRIDNIDYLIGKGADVNARDNSGRTPLMYAAGRGVETSVELLLSKGADIKAVAKDGKTALDYAANPRVADVLKKTGATSADPKAGTKKRNKMNI